MLKFNKETVIWEVGSERLTWKYVGQAKWLSRMVDKENLYLQKGLGEGLSKGKAHRAPSRGATGLLMATPRS